MWKRTDCPIAFTEYPCWHKGIVSRTAVPVLIYDTLGNRLMNRHIRFKQNTLGALRLAMGLALAAGAFGVGQSALAATATGIMNVTATVSSSCVVATSTLAFPSATSAAIQAGNIDAAGTVSVNCTTGSSYTVALDKGAGGTTATTAVRRMLSGTNPLNYTVYSDATRTTVWGDTTTGAGAVTRTGTGAADLIPAYGRIFSGQTVPAGAYTDVINVTVTY